MDVFGPLNRTLDIEKFKEKYKDVIQDVPGKTQMVQHDIRTGDALPIL